MNKLASVKRSGISSGLGQPSLEHYLLILLHRRWLILIVFLVVSAGAAVYSYRLPNVYTSETLILVDPQQIPSDYVRSTVSGDVRNRLSTLSQQILSASRLERVIEKFNLYPEEMKKMQREDVIAMMRKNIIVNMAGGGGGQDLQAFRVTYSNNDPKLTAKVTTELASLFIEENLNAREQLSTGTTEFLDQQLEETRTNLETLEARIGAFKMKHLGEMPEQSQSNIQILAQLQARLQVLADSIYRDQQQRSYLQALVAAETPVLGPSGAPVTSSNQPTPAEAQLQALLSRYGENYPDVKRLRLQVEVERKEREAAQRKEAERPQQPQEALAAPKKGRGSPEIQAQLASLDGEIAKYKQDQQEIIKSIASYQGKLDAVPVREQEVADLMRDYGISKDHYSQLLDKKLGAQMATQLEILQKGEKFTVLDPAQVPQKPSKPNRLAINGAGALGGLGLGFFLALFTEFLGTTIISPSQVSMDIGLGVLGVIPTITTRYDQLRRRRRILAGAVAGVAAIAALGAFLFIRFHDRIF